MARATAIASGGGRAGTLATAFTLRWVPSGMGALAFSVLGVLGGVTGIVLALLPRTEGLVARKPG